MYVTKFKTKVLGALVALWTVCAQAEPINFRAGYDVTDVQVCVDTNSWQITGKVRDLSYSGYSAYDAATGHFFMCETPYGDVDFYRITNIVSRGAVDMVVDVVYSPVQGSTNTTPRTGQPSTGQGALSALLSATGPGIPGTTDSGISAYLYQGILNGAVERSISTNGGTGTEPKWTAESNLYYRASNPSNYVTSAITNGLATTNTVLIASNVWSYTYSNGAFYLTVSTNGGGGEPLWVAESNLYYTAANTAGYVTASITNDLYPASNPSNFVTAVITNGMATLAQGIAGTNAQARVAVLETNINASTVMYPAVTVVTNVRVYTILGSQQADPQIFEISGKPENEYTMWTWDPTYTNVVSGFTRGRYFTVTNGASQTVSRRDDDYYYIWADGTVEPTSTDYWKSWSTATSYSKIMNKWGSDYTNQVYVEEGDPVYFPQLLTFTTNWYPLGTASTNMTEDFVTSGQTSGWVVSSHAGFVDQTITNGLASIGYVDLATQGLVTASITNGLYPSSNPSNFVTEIVTNGLASIGYVDNATNSLYPRNNPSNYVTEAVTNGLASIGYVDAATQNLVTASVTNGLASIGYVDNATQGLVTASITNGLYPSSNPSNFVTAAITNGLASIGYVDQATQSLVTASVTNGLVSIGYVDAATNGLLSRAETNGWTVSSHAVYDAMPTNAWNAATNNALFASNGVVTLNGLTNSFNNMTGKTNWAGAVPDGTLDMNTQALTHVGSITQTVTTAENYLAGNTGIGTNNPGYRLHIIGPYAQLAIGTTNQHVQVLLISDTNAENSLNFQYPSGEWWKTGLDNGPNGTLGDYAIKTNNNISPNFIIKHDTGRIGIGTNIPATLLDVAGDATVRGSIIQNVAATTNSFNAGTNYFSGIIGIGNYLSPNNAQFYLHAQDDSLGPVISMRQLNNVAYGYDFMQDNGVNGDLWINRIVNSVTNEVLHIARASGNIGLGTNNPATKLDVAGNVRIQHNSYDALTIVGATNNAVGLRIQNTFTSARNWNISSSGGGPSPVGSFLIYDDTAAATRLVIATNGNVGVSTISPATTLDCNGTATVRGAFIQTLANTTNSFNAGTNYFSGRVGIGTTTPSNALTIASAAGSEFIRMAFATNPGYLNHGIWGNFNNGTPSLNAMIFNVNNGTNGAQLEVMRMLGDGKVGIGVTPSTTLDVNGAVTIRGATDHQGKAITNASNVQSTTMNVGSVTQNVANALNSFSAGTNYFSGKVGIGSATPSFPLSLGTGVGNKIGLYDGGFGTGYGFGIQGNLLQIFCNLSTDRVGIGYGNSTSTTSFAETLTVKGANVGVGTTNPGKPLTVVADAAAEAIRTYRAVNNVGWGVLGLNLALNNSTSGVTDYAQIGGGIISNTATTEAGMLTLSTKHGGSMLERMRIDNLGNVGINSTSPTYPLTFGSTLGNKISLYESQMWGLGLQSSLLQFIVNTSAGDFAFGSGTSASFAEVMRVKGTGNVGIGTTVPGTKLEIASSVLATNTINVSSVFRMTRPVTGGVKYGNAMDILLGSFGTAIQSQSRADFQLANGDSSVPNTTVLTLLSSGNIGIGTNAPATTLDVLGQITARSLPGTGTPNPLAKLNVYVGAVGGTGADGVSSPSNGVVFGRTEPGIMWPHAAIWTVGSAGWNGDMVFGTDGGSDVGNQITERMRIDHDGNASHAGYGVTNVGYLGLANSNSPLTMLATNVAGTNRLTVLSGTNTYYWMIPGSTPPPVPALLADNNVFTGTTNMFYDTIVIKPVVAAVPSYSGGLRVYTGTNTYSYSSISFWDYSGLTNAASIGPNPGNDNFNFTWGYNSNVVGNSVNKALQFVTAANGPASAAAVTHKFTTNSTISLQITHNNTPPASATNWASIWVSNQVSAVMYTQNGAGSNFKISPHNEDGDVVLEDFSEYTGERRVINATKQALAVQEICKYLASQGNNNFKQFTNIVENVSIPLRDWRKDQEQLIEDNDDIVTEDNTLAPLPKLMRAKQKLFDKAHPDWDVDKSTTYKKKKIK